MSKLENDIADSLSEQMAKEIDKQLLEDLMTSILIQDGWVETKINPAFDRSYVPHIDWYAATAEWIHLNAIGDYKLLKGQWLFEKKEDAVMFTLKWS